MSESGALDTARAAMLRGDYAAAERIVLDGIRQTPSPELKRTLAGIYRQTGRDVLAKDLLEELLATDPGDLAAGVALASLYRDQGRFNAAGSTLQALLQNIVVDSGSAIELSRLFSECDRNGDALAVTEAALRLEPDEKRLHVRAAMFCMQLGRFDDARRHYLQTLEDPVQACEWHVPAGLANAQRYTREDHPDFARFRELLDRHDLGAKARASLNFAMGKACDDIGDYASASRFFREANALTRGLRRWNRKSWRRSISSLMDARLPAPRPSPPSRATPLLIVGMPRSGSTLAAKLLSRHPDVCNRGELPWLGTLMQHPSMAGIPKPSVLSEAAAIYGMHLLRDDSDARWFIDKQPMNFRYVDRFLAMFPQARIIHCTRSPRDVALSLWSQSFSDEILGFSCDFADIAVVMQDCERLMARWATLFPASIRRLDYEGLVADPDGAIGQLSEWLGLPPALENAPPASTDTISTASLWQARQPVHQGSVARWRHYLPYLPELARFKAS